MTECSAEQSYLLNEPQRQRLTLEELLGEPSPSWLIAGATISGIGNLDRFQAALADLAQVYPVLRTTFVTTGPKESWHQFIRSCHDVSPGEPPIVHLPAATSWAAMITALQEHLQGRNPHYRYAAVYGLDDTGSLRAVFAFDHMVFDIRSIDVVLARLAKMLGFDAPDHGAGSCRCGGNEFAPYVQRTTAIADRPDLPERYEWAHGLMLAARSPHAYVSLPVIKPMSIMAAGSAQRIRSRFVTDPARRHSYTPFAAFASALTLSLATNFESPAMFYTPTLNREAAEMESAGWFAGTPILPVRSDRLTPALAAERIVDPAQATAEVMAATTQTVRDGQLLTALVHRKLSAALGGRTPFMDCLEDSLPYIVLGYVDRFRDRTQWQAGDVVVRKARMAMAAQAPSLVPPGYILIRLIREKKAEWSVEVDYEAERYETSSIPTLMSTMEGYLRQLLG